MTSDREFINAAAKGLPLAADPFVDLARRLGMTEAEVIARIERLIAEKKVRRFAASVRHQHMGYAHNAMLIARVRDEEAVVAVGEATALIGEVSHCYERPHPDGWPHCVYIMVHGRDEATVEEAVEKVRAFPGVLRLEVCPSCGELKKTSLSSLGGDDD
jgi:DNA-binding Lrp family transcriptional regulator